MIDPLMTPAEARCDEIFNKAAQDISVAANKFKVIAGESTDNVTEIEGAPVPINVPVGVVCLRLAHQLWRDTHHRPTCPSGYGHAAGPQMPPEAVLDEQALEALPINQPMPAEKFFAQCAESMNPEQRDELIRALQALNARDKPPQAVEGKD